MLSSSSCSAPPTPLHPFAAPCCSLLLLAAPCSGTIGISPFLPISEAHAARAEGCRSAPSFCSLPIPPILGLGTTPAPGTSPSPNTGVLPRARSVPRPCWLLGARMSDCGFRCECTPTAPPWGHLPAEQRLLGGLSLSLPCSPSGVQLTPGQVT